MAKSSFAAVPTDKASALGTARAKVDFDDIVNDHERLTLLYSVTRYHAELSGSAIQRCLRLLNSEHVLYLIDFDVIRNFIEMGSVNKRASYAVNFVFFDSEVDYAIPIGAFQELLTYLSSLTRKGRQLADLGKDDDPTQVRRQIGRALGIRNVRAMDDYELDEKIGKELENSIVKLTRLLHLINSERFKGISIAYNNQHYEAWLPLVAETPRGPHRSGRNARDRRRHMESDRDERDARDAENLAVASTAISTKDKTCYFLISQTRDILNIFGTAKRSQTLKLADVLATDPRLLRGTHPAIRPQDAMTFELVRAVKNPSAALNRLRAREDTLRKLSAQFLTELEALNQPVDISGRVFGKRFRESRRHTQELLQQYAEDIENENSDLRQIEDARSTAVSIDLSYLRLNDQEQEQVLRDPVLANSVYFRRLLGEVAELLGREVGYELHITQPIGKIPFARVEVQQQGRSEPAILGEFYPGQSERGADSPFSYYALRWPISCREEDMIAALRSTWIVNSSPSTNQETPLLRALVVDDDLWREGVVLTTEAGYFGMELADVHQGGNWGYLGLREISTLIRRHVEGRQDPEGYTLYPAVEQIRVNTSFGDIIYDVCVGPSMARRYLTIISHFDLSIQVAALFEQTSKTFCLPTRLFGVLKQALSSFPPTPQPDVNQRAN